MFFAYNYARKKYKERQQSQRQPKAALVSDSVQPAHDAAAEADGGGTGVPPVTSDAVSDRIIETKEPKANDTPSLAKDDAPDHESPAEKARRRKYRWMVVLGLIAPFTLQSLDMTIVASALPYIATDFDQVSQLNWIISAFNLTSAAFLPLWAQVADIFGRHLAIQTAIVITMVGSAICTGAPVSAFGVLLLGRALQGVGVAGISISVRTILADRVSLKDFALNWTIFALVSAVSFSIGPVVGGYLTQASWRWCFAINLPTGVLAILLVIVFLRKELLGPQPLQELEGRDINSRNGRFWARVLTIDYGGQLLFLWGLGLLILALTWAGSTYSWNSAAVLSSLIIGAVVSLGWGLYEYLMAPGRCLARRFPFQRAMMPWELLSQRDIGLLFLINLAVGMAMFAVLYFMGIYFALVKGNSPSKAGLTLLFFLPGLGAGGYMAMFSANVWPRQTLHPLLLGSITTACGITVLSWAIDNDQTNVIYGMMALTGHGIGIRLNPGVLHGLAYFPTMTAAISCIVSFALPFGGMIALTIMGTVLNNKAGSTTESVKDGIRWAFVAIVPFMWVCVIITTFLGNVWILKSGAHEVVNGTYFWSLFTRKKLTREKRTRGDLKVHEAAKTLDPV